MIFMVHPQNQRLNRIGPPEVSGLFFGLDATDIKTPYPSDGLSDFVQRRFVKGPHDSGYRDAAVTGFDGEVAEMFFARQSLFEELFNLSC